MHEVVILHNAACGASRNTLALIRRLCRPSGKVLDILLAPQLGGFVKKDGEQVIDVDGQRVVSA
jgi:hypothetical protein